MIVDRDSVLFVQVGDDNRVVVVGIFVHCPVGFYIELVLGFKGYADNS